MDEGEDSGPQLVSLAIGGITYRGWLDRGNNSLWSGRLGGFLPGGSPIFDYYLDVVEGTLRDSALDWVRLRTSLGKAYEGQIKNGKFDGYGQQHHPGGYYENGKFADGLFVEGLARIASADGSVYYGNYAGGKPDGWGFLEGPGKDYQVGNFVNGSLFKGEVRVTDPADGSVYEGEYSNKSHNGYGKLTYKNGCSVEGEFENSQIRNAILVKKSPDGRSTFVRIVYDENGNPVLRRELSNPPERMQDGKLCFDKLEKPPTVFSIAWENDGDGELGKKTAVINFSDGSSYRGGYENEKFEGYGTLKDRDGNIVRQGIFENGGLKEGQTITDSFDGPTYRGYIEARVPNGKGRIDSPNGDYWDGNFVLGSFSEGNVRITDSLDGSVYEGGRKNGGREGYGKVVDSLGNTYRGDWKSGRTNGWGWLRAPGGDYWRGKFANGSFSEGKVRITNSGGDVYEGKYFGGKYEGYGKLTHSNGCSAEGEFKDGKARNVVLEKKSPTGRSTFVYVVYDDCGNLVLRQELKTRPNYRNGKLDFSGLDKLEDPSMEVPDRHRKMRGSKNDKKKITYGDGSVYIGKVDANGKPDGKGTWTGPGEEQKGGIFKNGRFIEGDVVMKLSNSITYRGGYKNGKFEGEGKLADANGEVLREGKFEGGNFMEGTARDHKINGSIYEGPMKDGVANGYGKLLYSNGEHRKGNFLGGLFSWDGVVRINNPDGSVYEGAYSGGKPDGQGLKKSPGGDYENGEFKDGSFSGNGKVRKTNPSEGSVYEGEYSNKLRHGYGKITHKNGCSMEGMFEGGLAKDIVLERKLPNDRSEFSHIIFDGNGNVLLKEELKGKPAYRDKKINFGALSKLKKPPMEVQPTTFDDVEGGDASGEVRITYGDGSVYTGEVNEDCKPNGNGEWTGPEEELRKGIFKDGKFESGTVVMKLSNSITYRGGYKNGKFEEYGELEDREGGYYKKGKFRDNLFLEGNIKSIDPNGTTREVYLKDGLFIGLRKVVHLNGDYEEGTFITNSLNSGKVKKSYPDGSSYEGECFNGLRHGYGKITHKGGSTEEGEFSNGVALKTFHKFKGNNICYYQVYNSEGKLILRQLLSKAPVQVEDEERREKRFKMDAERELLLEETYDYSYPRTKSSVKHYFYKKDGSLEKTVTIDLNLFNKLLSSGKATNLGDLMVEEAIVIQDGENKVLLGVPPHEIIKSFRHNAEKIAALREAPEGASGFNDGSPLEAQNMLLSLIGEKDLKNLRFCTEQTSHTSMTSFLESIGMDEKNLAKSEESYIVMWAKTDANDHAVCFLVNLKSIREVVSKTGWYSLNESTRIFIHFFDSSRVVGSGDYGGSFGSIGKNCGPLNRSQQKEGSCWLQAVAAVLAALENPEVVERVLNREIPTYGLGECTSLGADDTPDKFTLKQIAKLQQIADDLAIKFKGKEPLAESVILDCFRKRMAELADSEKLLLELDRRIEEAFDIFEKKLREMGNGAAELESERYRNYRRDVTGKITGKYKEELSRAASEKDRGETSKGSGDRKIGEKTKKLPGFIKNLKKFVAASEEMDRQKDNLEDRLELALERFLEARKGATGLPGGELDLVNILEEAAKALEKKIAATDPPLPLLQS
ncbi:MAG: hypothetical protein LBU15_02385 [Rickettsiales bacterium]|jgi:hypothetical protein|nr:hypothetical protein [Rickettsiales bacterium]